MLGDERLHSSQVGPASMSNPSCSPGPSYWPKGKSKGVPHHHTTTPLTGGSLPLHSYPGPTQDSRTQAPLLS